MDRYREEACSEDKTDFRLQTEAVSEDICIMLDKKNRDYGDDNLLKFGTFGILVRCSDKISRLEHIMTSKTNAVGESEEQEWLDIAGYAIQALRIIRNR